MLIIDAILKQRTQLPKNKAKNGLKLNLIYENLECLFVNGQKV